MSEQLGPYLCEPVGGIWKITGPRDLEQAGVILWSGGEWDAGSTCWWVGDNTYRAIRSELISLADPLFR
jgi:hypothetical protein